MAFHGHTKIELHNVETGEDKVIEKHNIFTNYLHDIMQIIPSPYPMNWLSCGRGSNRYGATQWDNQDNKNNGCPSIIDILAGGLLCFSNTKESSPENYFLTSDDVVVARGANIANASTDNQLGSYNTTLEVITDTSKTMVWDFTQNQGNGTISTVGLTSIGMALCGLGGFPPNVTHTSASPFGDVCFAKNHIFTITGTYDDEYPTTNSNYMFPIYVSIEHNFAIGFVSLTSRKLCLRYYDLNGNNISPLNPGSAYATSNSYNYKYVGRDYGSNRHARYSITKRVEFDLTNYIDNNSYINMHITKEGVMYLCLSGTYQWSNGSTMKFVKINLITKEILGNFTITNTTGQSLYTCSMTYSNVSSGLASGVPPQYYCQVVDGYMLFRTYSNPLRTFAINLEDNTNVKEILTEEGEAFSIDEWGCDFAGRRLFSDSRHASNTSSMYIVDAIKGVAHRVRTGQMKDECFTIGTSVASYNYVWPVQTDSKLLNMWHLSPSSNYFRYSYGYLTASYKQDTLTTINVLDEPVIKTPSMTMRITYTISLEEDEE